MIYVVLLKQLQKGGPLSLASISVLISPFGNTFPISLQ